MFNLNVGIEYSISAFIILYNMNILIKRIAKKDTYTIGKFYIDGKYYCDTIEDKDRGIDKTTPLSKIKSVKIANKTAIPTGTYDLTMKVQSPKYLKSNTFVRYCKAYMPRILNIPGFDGVLLHTGNTAEDSSGCIILGYNKTIGKVLDSMSAFKQVYPILKAASDKGDRISITIQ